MEPKEIFRDKIDTSINRVIQDERGAEMLSQLLSGRNGDVAMTFLEKAQNSMDSTLDGAVAGLTLGYYLGRLSKKKK